MRDSRLVFFALCAVISLMFLFTPESKQPSGQAIALSDSYDPNMSRITSIYQAGNFIDSVYQTKFNGKFDTIDYVKTVSSFVKLKFCHGISHYSLKENWIANLLGKFIWSHLSVKVNPDDIMKQNNGLCSQQAIVFMDLLEKKKIKNRSVGLGYKEGPGHFLTEVFYNGEWHVYDVNKEPKWEKIKDHHKSMEYYMSYKDTLFVAYEDQMEAKTFYKMMERVKYGVPGEFAAKRMLFFHRVTKVFTYILPCLFFVIVLLRFRKLRAKKNGKTINEELLVKSEKSIV